MAAPLKNQNAKKDPSKVSDSHLNIRVNRKDMDRWKLAAKKAGAESFTDWVIENLSRESVKILPREKKKAALV